jgi:8-oxo-dGTP pyrophosphatase MutT (NUDIX family)
MTIHESFHCVYSSLPLHAEEGTQREVASEAEIAASVAVAAGKVAASAIVQGVRAVYEAMALLDTTLLETGQWAFVSFPASLAARSILLTLATPGQTLVVPHYWEQGSHRPASEVDEQRSFLNMLETRRQRFHPSGTAEPIRTVHVAWGVIKIEDRYLMVRRDDKLRNESGDYVFPGGRLNLSDLPLEMRGPKGLRDLFRVDSAVAKQSLQRTLSRELEEECGLKEAQFELGQPLTLPLYQKVEGAGNQHALSQYNIVVYPVQLIGDGELCLLDHESRFADQFAWFTQTELLQDTRLDGKKAFVNALKSNDNATSEDLLRTLPNSSVFAYPNAKDTDAIDLPAEPFGILLHGKSGKEAAVKVSLSESEWGMLLLLGWHSRSLPVKANPTSVQLMGNGWIKLLTEDTLNAVERLIQKLEFEGLPGPMRRGNAFCRLSVDPDHTFFSKELFSFHLPPGDQDQPLTLMLKQVKTIWGELGAAEVRIELTRNMVRVIRSIETSGDADAPNIKGDDLERQVRGIFKPAQGIGLRKFIFVSKGKYKLASKAAE